MDMIVSHEAAELKVADNMVAMQRFM